jgi:hypothetical protein
MLSSVLKAKVAHRSAWHFASLASNNMARRLSSIPLSVKVSAQELKDKQLTRKNVELATRALHRDGLVVLENVIDHTKLDFLNDRMVEDSSVLQAAGDPSPYNYNKG